MGKLRYFKTSVVVCCLAIHFAPYSQQLSPGASTWQVYFPPRGGATDAIVDAIDEAHTCVLVQAKYPSREIVVAPMEARPQGLFLERRE